LGDAVKEGLKLVPRTFGDEFDAAVGQVANGAGDVVATGKMPHRRAKTDAMDTAGIVDDDAFHADLDNDYNEREDGFPAECFSLTSFLIIKIII